MTAFALRLYQLFGHLAGPLVRRVLRSRAARGREDPARLPERLGRAGRPRPAGPLVWIHASSVGESLSVLPLIARLRRGYPMLAVLVTTGTVTSARLMAERLPEGVIHQYAPVDLPQAVTRFLDYWQPALGLIVESELWPNLLLGARQRGIPLALINARLSARSERRWRRLRPMVARLLGLFSLVLAQSPEDQVRLRGLGAAEIVDRAELAEPSKRPLESERWAGCVDAVGGTTLARVLGQMAYGHSVAAVGLAGGSTLETTVLPFLLRGVNLLGIDSVMCPPARRRAAWTRLAKELPMDKLDAMTTEAGLGDLLGLGKDILKGKVRGRLVVGCRD